MKVTLSPSRTERGSMDKVTVGGSVRYRERGGSHNDGLTTSNTGSNLEDSRMQMASMHYLTIAITLQADARC